MRKRSEVITALLPHARAAEKDELSRRVKELMAGK